jgi:hypothetical protein
MNFQKCVGYLFLFTCLFVAGYSGIVQAASHKTPGGGSDGGLTPVVITFRDAVGDRIGSDGGGPYIDGTQNVEAFIGSKANYGNVWLKNLTSRALFVDFADCVSGSCIPPFSFANQSPAAIKVDANDVIKDGLFGMSVGDISHVPMRIYLGDPNWFIDFNPGVKAKYCKESARVKVERTAPDTWVITGEQDPLTGEWYDIGCLSEHTATRDTFLGNFHMPFRMTVRKK